MSESPEVVKTESGEKVNPFCVNHPRNRFEEKMIVRVDQSYAMGNRYEL
jgi:hypothetical protein